MADMSLRMAARLSAFMKAFAPAPTKVSVLYGDLRSGRIHGELKATGADWAQALNRAGSIDQVRIPDDVVRALDLRRTAASARSFLALEIDDRVQEAGPIWSRNYDWERGELVLGAAGLWSLWDHRSILPVLLAGQKVRDATTTVSGVSLGGVARAWVAQAMTWVGGGLPLDFAAADVTGDHTETVYGWELANLGDRLRQLTGRQTAAPDIRFVPYRDPNDRRFMRWRMETGTEAVPQLAQAGKDWLFDTTPRRGPVLGISTDEDGTAMGSLGWVTGNGSEADTVIGTDYDPALVDDAQFPLLEVEESRPTVEDQATADGYAADLVGRSARPVEVWKVDVHISAAREVSAGDFCRIRTKNNPWLGTGETRMRLQRKSGDLGEVVTLNMYPIQPVVR